MSRCSTSHSLKPGKPNEVAVVVLEANCSDAFHLHEDTLIQKRFEVAVTQFEVLNAVVVVSRNVEPANAEADSVIREPKEFAEADNLGVRVEGTLYERGAGAWPAQDDETHGVRGSAAAVG